MNLLNKIFSIFALLSEARKATLVSVKTFREPFYFHFPLALHPVGVMSLEGLFIWFMQYISSSLSNKVYLPLELIRDAVANNWLDTLCYYLWIKKLHRKPIIYAYSLRKISAAINCSPTTVKTHISILKQHGLVEIGGGNLILKSTNSFFRESRCLVPVAISHNKADQRNLLRFATIKRNLHTQYRTFSNKSKTLYYHQGTLTGYHEVKQALKLAKQYPDPITLESSMQDDLTLSNKKFGSLCNRSQSTGLKIQKALNDLNLIVSTSRTRLISPKQHNRREFFRLNAGPQYFLSKKGQVYKRMSNAIRLVKVISSVEIIEQGCF